MSSAIGFNLDQSKILSSGNGLRRTIVQTIFKSIHRHGCYDLDKTVQKHTCTHECTHHIDRSDTVTSVSRSQQAGLTKTVTV